MNYVKYIDFNRTAEIEKIIWGSFPSTILPARWV
jgi:hypothetical protein